MEPVSSRLRRRARLLLAALIFGLVPSTVVLAHPKTALASSAYETAVLADSPSVYYRLGESSGTTAVDDSGNGNDGTYQSSATLGATGALTGDSDTAVSFDGSTQDGVTASGAGLPSGSSARTMEMWFKTTSGSSPTLMAYGGSISNPYQGFLVWLDGSKTICGDAGGSNVCIAAPYTLNDGNWHSTDVVYDGNVGVTIYIDGQDIGSGSFLSQLATTVPGSSGLDLAGDLWSGDQLTGSLDEVAIYPTALSAAHINNHWRAGVAAASCPSTPTAGYAGAVAADNPNRYFQLTESSGASATDYSGNCMDVAYDNGVTHGAGPLLRTTNDAVESSGSVDMGSGSPDGLPTGSSARTLEIWEKTTTNNDPAFMGYGTPTTAQYASIELSSATSLCMCFWGDSATFSSPYSLEDGNWHYLAVTYDGSVVKGYVDGQEIGTVTPPTTPNTGLNGVLELGGWNNSGGSLDGSLAQAAIYPTALSATQIREHYFASGNTPEPSGIALTATELEGGGINFCLVCTINKVVQGIATLFPVDTENGNFYHDFVDFDIPTRSYPLAVTRTYNSDAAGTDGPFGYGWSFNYGMNLAVSGTSPNEVATITQENGSQVTFDQPASGNVWTAAAPRYNATLTYNSGSSTWTFVRAAKDTITFNSSGQLTQMEDLNGYDTDLAYVGGKLDTVTAPDGRELTFGWTGSHITAITDSNVIGNTRSAGYAYSGGDLVDVTDVNGGDTHMTYSSHLMTVLKDPVCEALGGSCPGVQNHYDGSDRVDWQKDQLNRETTFAYTGSPDSASGGTTLTTDPVGSETLDTYQWGVRTAETKGYGTAVAATTYTMYDPATLAVTGTMDPNGGVTTYTVDTSGNVLTSTDPLGRVTTNTWNSCNEPLTTEDPNGVTTTNTWDTNCNLDSTSTPLTGTAATATNCASPVTAVAIAQVTCYTHGNGTYPGDVTAETDPDGKVTDFHHDANGYVDETKDPLGDVTAIVRNNDGWPTATYTAKAGCTWGSDAPTGCSSSYETQISYVDPDTSATNEWGDPAVVTDPLSHAVVTKYDLDRDVTSVKDGDGNVTTYTIDLAGELTTTTRPDSTTLVDDWNDDGTLHDEKDGAGHALETLAYNALKQVTSSTDALSDVTDFTHDLDGNLLSKSQGSSDVSFGWDLANQECWMLLSSSISTNACGSPPAGADTYTHDNDGQETGMTDGTGTSAWTWDSLHRPTSYTNGNGAVVDYGYTYGVGPTYELKDQPRTITYPNSVGTVSLDWNDDGTESSITDWNSKTIDLGYDDNKNLDSIVYPSTTNVTDTISVNDANQETGVSISNGTTLFAASYTRDNDGQVTSDSSVSSSVGNDKYNTLNQLCYAGSSTSNACGSPPAGADAYALSSADNLTNNNGNAQQFNNADQLCWVLPSGSSANACGSPPTGATTFGSDTSGNRTSEVPSSGPATCNGFDQLNELTEIKTGTGSTCTSSTTVGTYVDDGQGIRESKTVSGTTTQFTNSGIDGTLLQQDAGGTITSFIDGPDGIPLEQITGATTTYLHHDQLGSIRLITDSAGATGTATTNTWNPYGGGVSTSGSLTSPFGFAGMYTDAESGLLVGTHRYYDPTTATWLSVDPLVTNTMQPYQYVAGNPLNATDPLGLGIAIYTDPNGGAIIDTGADPLVTGGPYINVQGNNNDGWLIDGVSSALDDLSGAGCTLTGDGNLIGNLSLHSESDGGGSTTGPGIGPGGTAPDQPTSGDGQLNVPNQGPTVGDVLKGKKGSIKNAPLPPGSPGWNDITGMPIGQVQQNAQNNVPGYKTIWKLLNKGEYNK